MPSGSILTYGKNPKTLEWRTTAVTRWVDGIHRAPVGVKQSRFSPLAEAFGNVIAASSRLRRLHVHAKKLQWAAARPWETGSAF